MSIILESITFSKLDDDGNEIVDLNGNTKLFTTKDDFDHDLIIDMIDDDDLEECEQETTTKGKDNEISSNLPYGDDTC